ncbi:hypothetical protein E3P99_03013 [Wallemia hederae]|uniref:DUF747-domain-containing protein n=1 Tax=Wallemia hederae TaxID=1540922 RepID=A0A4T0FHM9_9BASI|nr:hypothetical protein E3P99_03013 [Wallemia hederae]
MTNDFYYSEPSSPQETHSPSVNELTTHSLWDYLREELSSAIGSEDSADKDNSAASPTHSYKAERVSNFLSVPISIEKVITFGSLACLDSFLSIFTILPLRGVVGVFSACTRRYAHPRSSSSSSFSTTSFSTTQKADLLKWLLFTLICAFLLLYTEPSRMYHGVRGQDNVKLYVIFNALEIADKLCCSIGQDVLDTLFAETTLQDGWSIAMYMTLALVYGVAHALVFLYQLVALNVAVNSYDNALLTLLISNQFVEIKGSVFKKFDKESLFQITCADIVERFQLMLMLSVIAFRNLIELSGSDFTFLPRAFMLRSTSSTTHLETIFSPVLLVILSEMGVDWLKHAFITKFMHIRPTIYGRFMDILAGDFLPVRKLDNTVHMSMQMQMHKQGHGHGQMKHINTPTNDLLSHRISRRLGFAAIPLAAFVVRVAVQALGMLSDSSALDECAALPPSALQKGTVALQWFMWILVCLLAWLVLLAIKLVLGIRLLAFAHHRQTDAVARKTTDVLTNLQTPIGETKQDKDDRVATKHTLSNSADDVPNAPKKIPLEDLSRYDMVKRIW